MQSYLRHMRSDGILAVHITNRYLDLQPVVAAAAAKLGLSVLVVELEPAAGDVFCRRSLWALIVRPARAAGLQTAIGGARPLPARAGFTAWTDGFSNLLGILK
ncbi:MAG: hypothetical protein FAZ92_03163 [Accumulibacter sp.]|nr:MAG: hypothetical protein FAZ92_03163 [Accumulibacter sp.]